MVTAGSRRTNERHNVRSSRPLAGALGDVDGQRVERVAFDAWRQWLERAPRTRHQRLRLGMRGAKGATLLNQTQLQLYIVRLERSAQATVGQLPIAHQDDWQRDGPLP